MGDPGVTHDIATPFDSLPPYLGPAEPGAGMPPDGERQPPICRDERPSKAPLLRTRKPPTPIATSTAMIA